MNNSTTLKEFINLIRGISDFDMEENYYFTINKVELLPLITIEITVDKERLGFLFHNGLSLMDLLSDCHDLEFKMNVYIGKDETDFGIIHDSGGKTILFELYHSSSSRPLKSDRFEVPIEELKRFISWEDVISKFK